MLVTRHHLPVTLAVLALFVVRTADAAERASLSVGGWTQAALDAGNLPRDEADKAFGATPEDATRPIARVDESALRYYASQHATARVEAEIRRLRALYPGWEPPVDLYKPGAGDEQALWDLYGKNRLDDLKLEIERRATRQPGWRPSQEMVEKLRLKEKRNELVSLSEKSDWRGVLDLVEREPLLVGPGDLDVVWRIAEARGRTDNLEGAVELYRIALGSARDVSERQGTVRKALAVLGADRTLALVAAEERTGADGKGEFEGVRLDISRARLGEWLRPETSIPLPERDLQRVTAAAEASNGTGGDAALLGWIEHKRKREAAASKWFQLALGRGETRAALGAVLAAEADGRHDDALGLADANADDGDVAALYLDLLAADLARPRPTPIAPPRLARFASLTEKLESGDAAQALAWYAYGARQFPAARAWFAKAMVWRPTSKTAEGHLLAVKASGDQAELVRLATDYRGRFPDLPPIEKLSEARVKVASGPVKRPCGAILSARAHGTLAPADALAAGWCLLEVKHNEEAATAFEAARRTADGRIVSEAAYGAALAYLRSNRTADAARVASSGNLPPNHREEIGRVVLAQQAIAYFEHSDWASTLATLDRRRAHVTEPRDLMTMRGWALYHLGRKTEAGEVFTTLDGQMSTSETRAGLAATTLSAGRRS